MYVYITYNVMYVMYICEMLAGSCRSSSCWLLFVKAYACCGLPCVCTYRCAYVRVRTGMCTCEDPRRYVHPSERAVRCAVVHAIYLYANDVICVRTVLYDASYVLSVAYAE